MRLTRRLALSLVAVTGATLLAAELGVYTMVGAAEQRALDEAVLVEARAATELFRVEHALGSTIEPVLPDQLIDESRYAALYDRHGRVFATSPALVGRAPELSALGGELVEAARRVDLVEGDLDLRAVILPVPSTGWVLLFGISREAQRRTLAVLAQVLSLTFVLGVGAAVVTAQLLARRLAEDVLALARVAGRVSDGDVRARANPRRWGSAETKVLASDLDHMIERLGGLLSSQRSFVSYAAHELRSPLTALRGELQLALRRPRSLEEYQAALAEALSNVDMLVHLAEDLLTLARVQAGSPAGATCQCHEVLESAVRMARGLAEVREVTLLEPPDDEPLRGQVLRGGALDLSRALRNLIDNAILHGPQGGRVRITLATDGALLVVGVEDDGRGVAEADREQVFEPFVRGSQSAKTAPGAGLGLSIARGIAESVGGSLVLAPRGQSSGSGGTGGTGARFELRLTPPQA